MIIGFEYSHSDSYTAEEITWGLSYIRLEVFGFFMHAFGRTFGVSTSCPEQDLSIKKCVGNDHSRLTFLDLDPLYSQ